MTPDTKHDLKWWAYAVSTVVLFVWLDPALVSAQDTLLTLCGILLLVSWGVWTWKFWLKALILYIYKFVKDENEKLK